MRMEVEGRGMGGLIRLKSIERIKSQMEGPSTRPAVCLRFRRHPQRISIVFFCFFGSNSSAARLSFFFLFSFSTHPSPASVLWFAMHSCNSLRRHQNGRSFFFSFFFNIYSLAGNGTKDNIRDSDSVAVRSIAIGSAWLNWFRQKKDINNNNNSLTTFPRCCCSDYFPFFVFWFSHHRSPFYGPDFWQTTPIGRQ